MLCVFFFFFSSRRRHTRWTGDWSSDVCSSDLMWRSVLTQQLQADMLACDMSSQLLNIAPDHEAKLYYSTMLQDESRHTRSEERRVGKECRSRWSPDK